MRRTLATLTVLATLAFPAAANAITPGAVTVGADSRPTFTWTPAAGEQSPAVLVSKTNAVGSDSQLSSLLDYQWFENDATTSWTTDDKYFAGSYFFQVTASDAEWNKVVSPVGAFTVAPQFTPAPVSFTCVRRRKLSLRSGWTTNVPDLAYRVQIMQGRRRLENLKYTEYLSTSNIGNAVREDHDWTPLFASSFARNAAFRATVTVTGPGVNFSKVLTARCR
jgi:hypothetical protein